MAARLPAGQRISVSISRNGARTATVAPLRFVRRVASDAQLEAFFAEAFAQFDAWAAAGQEAVRAQSKKLRQAFLQNITDLLKPLGFQKRGNHWRLPYRACAVMDFHAQKSSHSDTYYLRFCLSPPRRIAGLPVLRYYARRDRPRRLAAHGSRAGAPGRGKNGSGTDPAPSRHRRERANHPRVAAAKGIFLRMP